MKLPCPRCRRENLQIARFCSTCGLSLSADSTGKREAGRIAHPEPLPVADGFRPIASSKDLYQHWESAWGATALLGTEPIRIEILNAGYPLKSVQLELHGVDRDGQAALRAEREIETWGRGERVVLEVASYEIAAPVHELEVRLVGAEFEWEA